MFCTNCGSEVSPDNTFCNNCGTPVTPEGQEAPASAAPPPTPPAQPPTPPVQAPMPPPQPQAAAPIPPAAPVSTPPPAPSEAPAAAPAKQKGGKKWLAPVLIGGAILVIAAVVLVLVFVVFGGGGPQAAVNDLYKALGKKDSAAVIALVDTSELTKSGLETKFKEYIKANMPSSGITFTGLKFETTVNGNNATVKTVGGKITYKDESGKTVTEDITKSIGSNTTYLVKKDGKWLLDTKTFPEFYATEYLKAADATLEKMGTDMTAELNNVTNAIAAGAQGVTSWQELDARFKAQVPAAEKTIADLKKQAEETKFLYSSVESLEGVKSYQDYASLRVQSVDVIIEELDKLKKYLDELSGYINGLAANPPTTQAAANAATQGVDNIVNSYQAESETLSKKGTDLENQANQLKESLGL